MIYTSHLVVNHAQNPRTTHSIREFSSDNPKHLFSNPMSGSSACLGEAFDNGKGGGRRPTAFAEDRLAAVGRGLGALWAKHGGTAADTCAHRAPFEHQDLL